MAEYHHPEYLTSSADLETDLADQTVRVFDATVFLVPTEFQHGIGFLLVAVARGNGE